MSLRLIIGKPGSGKTRRVFEEIQKNLTHAVQGESIILLVPEQYTFQLEQALLNYLDTHTLLRIKVLSFQRLAQFLRQEMYGLALIPIEQEGKKILLHKILKQAFPDLKVFRQAIHSKGFINQLYQMFREIKQYDMNLETIRQDTTKEKALHQKISEIDHIFQLFTQQLENRYIDEEEFLNLLSEHIPNSNFLKNAQIWVDGFHGFTPQEYRVIEQMLKCAKQVNVTCCSDPNYFELDEMNIFYTPTKMGLQLCEIAEQNQINVQPHDLLSTPLKFSSGSMLQHIQTTFPMRKKYTGEKSQQVEVFSASNRRVEVENLARKMVEFARDHGAKWSEMGVVLRDFKEYEHLISNIFSSYRVPHFLDQKSTVVYHPLLEFIQASIEVPLKRWSYEAIFRVMKTGLLLETGEEEAFYRLENYVFTHGIMGLKWKNEKWWLNLTEEEIKIRDRIVKSFSLLENELKKSKNAKQMCHALYEFLRTMEIEKKIQSFRKDVYQIQETVQIWNNVIHVLDQFVEIMQEEELDLASFSKFIQTGLESIEIASIPLGLDQVIIGDFDRSRFHELSYVFLLGVNEGSIPAAKPEFSLLAERDREYLRQLGHELLPGQTRRLLDENFYIYLALTLAQKYLWISYPIADDGGAPLLASEIIYYLKFIFPKLSVCVLKNAPESFEGRLEQLSFLSLPEQTLPVLIHQLRATQKTQMLHPLWKEVYNWFYTHDLQRNTLQAICTSLTYENQTTFLEKDTSEKLFGKTLSGSVTRMERFMGCPFVHYVEKGLRLKKRQPFQLAAFDIGQLFHDALYHIGTHLQKEEHITVEKCKDYANEAIASLGLNILNSSARYRYFTERLIRILANTSAALTTHMQKGSFHPVGLEIDFGPGKTLPPLQVELSEGVKLELGGRIDRVDAADHEDHLAIRIIDYKSSSKELVLEEVYYGLSLQLLVYLETILTHAEGWLGKKAEPAGMLYFHVHRPIIQSKGKKTKAQLQLDVLKSYKMKGFLLEDRETLQLMDQALTQGTSDYLPFGIKKDGSFLKSSSLLSKDQWEVLRDWVKSKMREAGDRIVAGEIKASPYRLKQKTACQYCDYHAICQFDEAIPGFKFRDLKSCTQKELWENLSKKGKEDEYGEMDGGTE